MEKQVHLKRFEIPEGWSIESADFINKVSIKHMSKFKVPPAQALQQNRPEWQPRGEVARLVQGHRLAEDERTQRTVPLHPQPDRGQLRPETRQQQRLEGC